MRGTLLLAAVAILGLFAGCSPKSASDEGLLAVTLPDGREIRVEVLTRSEDIMRGMMFRESLAPDRGMLFVHTSPGHYSYWMFQCLIPLDIIWLDAGKRIVEISANTPPCKGGAKSCPSYGGNHDALYVLEIAGGMAQRYGLHAGDSIRF
jgi:uncharacterized membrane protein (UPF0127 family)